VAAAAAKFSITQTPSDIVYSLGISSNNMVMIYMLPDPYFDAFVKLINLHTYPTLYGRT
jgi:hypothetical protein